MKLTGKCKEDFDKWYDMEYLFGLHHILKFTLDDFYSLPLKALQYGVYVDFFDSVGEYNPKEEYEIIKEHGLEKGREFYIKILELRIELKQ